MDFKEESLSKKYYISSSEIHGQGVFANKDIYPGEEIDIGINFIFSIFPTVTNYFGDFINHSWTPNGQLDYRYGKWYLIAIKKIKTGQEITMNYNVAPWYILPPMKDYT